LQYIHLHYFRTHISDTRRKFSRKLCYLEYNILLEFVIFMVMFNSKLGKNYISVIGKGPFSELGRVRSRNWERPVPIGNGSFYRTQLKKEKKELQPLFSRCRKTGMPSRWSSLLHGHFHTNHVHFGDTGAFRLFGIPVFLLTHYYCFEKGPSWSTRVGFLKLQQWTVLTPRMGLFDPDYCLQIKLEKRLVRYTTLM